MDLPTKAEKKACLTAFLNATSTEALRVEVCVICAREMAQQDGKRMQMEDLPHSDVLIPERTHPHHTLWESRLLLTEKLVATDTGTEGWCCDQCVTSLKAGKVPRLSLANGMWIGPIPEELSGLTIPEEMLIALQYPRCFVYKVYAKHGGAHNQDPDTLQSAMKGNVTSFQLNPGEVAHMIDGELYPCRPSILPSLVSVAFIGKRKPPKNWLKKMFRVRRDRVRRALIWLKTNHPRYSHIEIREDLLEQLPEDDIPLEILATMTHQPDDLVAEREGETYVVDDSETEEGEVPDQRKHQLIDWRVWG